MSSSSLLNKPPPPVLRVTTTEQEEQQSLLSSYSSSSSSSSSSPSPLMLILSSLNFDDIFDSSSDKFNPSQSYFIGLCCIIFFGIFHYVLKIKCNIPRKNDEYGARVVSLFHSVMSTLGCGYALWQHYKQDGWYDSPTTRLEANWCMFSWSYFAVDTVVMFLEKFDLTFFLHHVATLIANFWPAFLGVYGFPVAMAMMLGEAANPIMHLRWLVDAHGMRDTAFCRALTKLWFVCFSTLRICFGPWLVYNMVIVMPMWFAPGIIAVLVFSYKFIWDAVQSERKGEWWTG